MQGLLRQFLVQLFIQLSEIFFIREDGADTPLAAGLDDFRDTVTDEFVVLDGEH